MVRKEGMDVVMLFGKCVERESWGGESIHALATHRQEGGILKALHEAKSHPRASAAVSSRLAGHL